jgi:uroporphyrinogen decarboxylase
LAEATVALHRQFDTDLIKLTPSGLYAIQDWGATLRFGLDEDTAPVPTRPTVASADDWMRLPPLDVQNGALKRELEMIERVVGIVGDSVPVLMTIFSPLTLALKLRWGPASKSQVIDDLRNNPAELHRGLEVICDVTRAYALASLDAGASGIFFATQLASKEQLTVAEYKEFGVDYDLPVLEAVQGRSRITMLHLCGGEVMFDLSSKYPCNVVSWAGTDDGVTVGEARRQTDKCLATGLTLSTLETGTPGEVREAVHSIVREAGGRGLILAPACVVPGPCPDANLAAARRAVDVM